MDFCRISASKDEQLRTGIKGVAGLFSGGDSIGEWKQILQRFRPGIWGLWSWDILIQSKW